MTRGYKNNNPGNIRSGGAPFIGEIRPSLDREFRQFSHMRFGYRAMFLLLLKYISRGQDTIREIISTWAPASENATDNYIKAVSEWTGLNPDELITRNDKDKLISIVCAISRFENGVEANLNHVKDGLRMLS